jgi:1A family penicillin-binding protein
MQRPTNRGQQRKIKRRVWLRWVYVFVGGFALAFGCMVVLRFLPLPVIKNSSSVRMYAVGGERFDHNGSGVARREVGLDEIAPAVVQATVAVEDRRFYQHMGIDAVGIARAMVADVKAGYRQQGGSTITQQLARNLYLTQDRTIARKLNEVRLALQLEAHYSKDELLEKYLNTVYYGHGAYGIEAAAQLYFGKPAKQLTLAESAMLVGIPKGPTYYSPLRNPGRARERQHAVLAAMQQAGVIDARTREAAGRAKLVYKRVRPQAQVAAYFADAVKQTVKQRFQLSEAAYNQSGLRIYTTLDMAMQRDAERIVRTQLAGTDLQAALIALDPRNGAVRAMVGGKNYADNQYNRVYASTRQPGSSFKPFVYLTALHHGAFTATQAYTSEPTVFTYEHGTKQYMPRNYADKYVHAPIRMRQALMRSDNIYAVHLLMDVGAAKVVRTARQLGITAPLQAVPALALGASPVSPLEMASAYGTIADQGVRAEPALITRIADRDGRTLYEATPRVQRVYAAAPTYVVTRLMQSVFEPGGTGNRVSALLHRPVAAKTGTTDTDAWMVGFTPELSTAVWVGYDKSKPISTSDSRLAAPIFATFVDQALAAQPPSAFQAPKGIVEVDIDPATGLRATEKCPDHHVEAFLVGTEPKLICRIHNPESNPAPNHKPNPDDSWWDDFRNWWVH